MSSITTTSTPTKSVLDEQMQEFNIAYAKYQSAEKELSVSRENRELYMHVTLGLSKRFLDEGIGAGWNPATRLKLAIFLKAVAHCQADKERAFLKAVPNLTIRARASMGCQISLKAINTVEKLEEAFKDVGFTRFSE